jgi:ankyrin repeat protein
LHHAAFQGDGDKVKELLKLYKDIEKKDASGRTPLHIAAYHGKDAVLKVHLDSNADQNARNYSGQTPLYNAASRGYVSTAAILVD